MTTNEDLDTQARALVAQMTLEEKLSLLTGKNFWETVPIDRLDIPSLKVSDGPNGARGGEFMDGTTAACFPACVSLAATFNKDLVRRVGKALGQEAQTKGAYVLLGPTVCCHRSPLGGRNFEAFSEDPLVSGLLAAEYVRGLQSERVGATVKHFVANEQDTRRFTVNETISDRALREIYLRAFEIVVKEADPWCMMTAYPKVNGKHLDTHSQYIQDILRNEWKYGGLTMSDWGAVSNAVESVKYRLALEMPGPPAPIHRSVDAVKKAIDSGAVTEEELDKCATDLMKLLRRTGKFDDRRVTPPEQAINSPEHQQIIREAGAEGVVLLKNKDNTLPIDTSKVKKVAMLGPLAKYAAAHGGGSASLNAHYKVSPWEAVQERFGDKIELTYSKGCHIFRVYPDLIEGTKNREGKVGFTADFFHSSDCSGESFWTEHYARGFFMTLMNTNVPNPGSARFTTTYTPAVSGKHYISFSGNGPSKMFIDGKLVSTQEEETPDSMNFILGVQPEDRFQFDFVAGQAYDIAVETGPSSVNNSELKLFENQVAAHVGLVLQEEMEAALFDEAIALANDADVAVCFVGNTIQWETEGKDLESMTLPADGSQDQLVAGVAQANPNTVVVITTGVPVELPWIDQAAAVMQGWYAGQESGNAIVDVLLGEVTPSGKLPISWPKKYEHTACYGNFGLDSYESRQVEYVEGVFVGYRHFDRHYGTEKEVHFPFGFGLSYTSFDLSEVKLQGGLAPTGSGGVTVELKVKNTGDKAGAETVQIYLEPPAAAGNRGRPPKSLVAFDKVHLQPGESKTIQLSFQKDAAAYWDERPREEGGYCWQVEEGLHHVLVGTSSHPADVASRLELPVAQAFSFAP
ncbi:glycoside hydrolase superfamily [Xylariales sp. PMI_506]|nr:glycoside hydrolase superfamily [Xylariales sp. PMI_506]